MDDDFNFILVFLIAFITCILIPVGMWMLVEDYRHFSTITNQCKTQGYIQSKTTRIKCEVEK